MWVAAALVLAAFGLTPVAAAAADDPAALRALAMRLANDNGSGSADIELTVASVAQLPVPLAIPGGAQVLGTVLRRPTGSAPLGMYRYTEYRVYLDSAQTPDDLVAALASALQPAGYQRKVSAFGQPAGGFAVSAPEMVALCKDETAPAVIVRSARRDGRTEAVVTETIPSPDNPQRGGTACSARPMFGGQDASPLPVLGAVDGVTVSRRSSNFRLRVLRANRRRRHRVAARGGADGVVQADRGRRVVGGGSPAVSDAGAVASFRRTVDGRARVVVVSLARIAQGRYLASIRNIAP